MSTKIQWSKRVPPHQIRRLYANDAQGMLDEDLLNVEPDCFEVWLDLVYDEVMT